ncbi:tetratricopeptide repeat protein [candidate division KSB1 bacterium]|nr:tetratricopeptide repeat protein [candidate division KSB1 bacterium]
MRRFIIGLLLIVFASCAPSNNATKFYKSRDYDAAIKECQQILTTDSTDVNANLLLAKCYQMQGKPREAVNTLTHAYKINATSYSTGKIRARLIDAKLQYSDSLIADNSDNAALGQLTSVVELDTTNKTSVQKLGDFYVSLGFLTQAEKQYRRLLKQDKKRDDIRTKLADIEKQTARADSLTAIAKADFDAYRYQRTIKIAEEALQAKADHKDANYYVAMANGAILYNKGGKSELWDAIEHFGKAMAMHPESGEPHYYMGLAYEKKDKREFENAIHEYETLLEKEPDSPFAKDAKRRIAELTDLRDRLKKFWGKE